MREDFTIFLIQESTVALFVRIRAEIVLRMVQRENNMTMRFWDFSPRDIIVLLLIVWGYNTWCENFSSGQCALHLMK